MDKKSKLLFFEYIEGPTVKSWLFDQSTGKNDFSEQSEGNLTINEQTALKKSLKEIAEKMGKSIATLHKSGIIHGDLTTSNFLLRKDDLSLVMIDFGLSYASILAEDRAVDLYVLERAFLSTHTELSEMVCK